MIEVPYWWDKKFSSLEATIYNERPDFFAERPPGQPIPTVKPAIPQSSDKGMQNSSLLAYMCRTSCEHFNASD